jgi:hypothetical protein
MFLCGRRNSSTLSLLGRSHLTGLRQPKDLFPFKCDRRGRPLGRIPMLIDLVSFLPARVSVFRVCLIASVAEHCISWVGLFVRVILKLASSV